MWCWRAGHVTQRMIWRCVEFRTSAFRGQVSEPLRILNRVEFYIYIIFLHVCVILFVEFGMFSSSPGLFKVSCSWFLCRFDCFWINKMIWTWSAPQVSPGSVTDGGETRDLFSASSVTSCRWQHHVDPSRRHAASGPTGPGESQIHHGVSGTQFAACDDDREPLVCAVQKKVNESPAAEYFTHTGSVRFTITSNTNSLNTDMNTSYTSFQKPNVHQKWFKSNCNTIFNNQEVQTFITLVISFCKYGQKI